MKDSDSSSWLEVRHELFARDEHEHVIAVGDSLGNLSPRL